MKSFMSRASLLIISPMVLAACAHESSAPLKRTEALKIETLNQRYAEFIQLPATCPQDAAASPFFPGAIIGALVPIAVDFAISSVQDYLKRIESESTGQFIAAGAGKLPSNGSAELVVARGLVGKPVGTSERQGSLEKKKWVETGLAAPPSFFLKMDLKTTTNGTGKEATTEVSVTPRFLQFAETIAKRGRDNEKTVAMVLVLRSTTAPEKANSTTAATGAEVVIPISFGKLKPGIEITGGEPHDPLGDLKRIATVKGLPACGAFNAYAFVTETEEPDKALTLLTTALDNGKDDLKKALVKAIQEALPQSESK